MNKQAARKTENYQKIRWLTNIAELLQIYYGLCVGYAIGHGTGIIGRCAFFGVSFQNPRSPITKYVINFQVADSF